jgi:Beta-fructosidases (levanase/invertase)
MNKYSPVPINRYQYLPDPPDFVFDTITFYEDGVLHIFYLSSGGRWSHISTADMITYKFWRDALTGGGADSPDCDCWTGSVIKYNNIYYLFYTGKNYADPIGDQKVMLATSENLEEWTKLPEKTFYADGIVYWNKTINGQYDLDLYEDRIHAGDEAFRDPHVFKDDKAGCFKMLLHARKAADGCHCFGVYVSENLLDWKPAEPLKIDNADMNKCNLDCPNPVFLGDRCWLLYSDARWLCTDNTNISFTDNVFYGDGTFLDHNWAVPKAAWDNIGKRYLVTGNIRASEGYLDSGNRVGAVSDSMMSAIRELYITNDGRLQTTLAREAVSSFCIIEAEYDESAQFKLPELCLIELNCTYAGSGIITLDFGGCYRLLLNTSENIIRISCQDWSTDMYGWHRGINFAESGEISLMLLINGSTAELFVYDQTSLAVRMYNRDYDAEAVFTALNNISNISLKIKTSNQ